MADCCGYNQYVKKHQHALLMFKYECACFIIVYSTQSTRLVNSL